MLVLEVTRRSPVGVIPHHRRFARSAGRQGVRHVRWLVIVDMCIVQIGDIIAINLSSAEGIRRGVDTVGTAATGVVGSLAPPVGPIPTPRIILLFGTAANATAVAQVHLEGAEGAGFVVNVVNVAVAVGVIHDILPDQPGPGVSNDHLLHGEGNFDGDAPLPLPLLSGCFRCACGGGDGPTRVSVATVKVRLLQLLRVKLQLWLWLWPGTMMELQQRVFMKVAAPAHAAAPSKRRRGAGRQMEIVVLGGGVI